MNKTSLHNLSRTHGRKRRRFGRGNASGRGSYSGRGVKGQRARTGGRKGAIRRSIRRTIEKLPKRRGFSSDRLAFMPVNLDFLERHFAAGSVVTADSLRETGVKLPRGQGIKILGRGALTKKLTVAAQAFSRSAEHAITKAGGSVRRVA